jgi:hypothetical protein
METAGRAVDALWGPKQLSEYIDVPVATLYQWHHLGKGPRAIRVGRHLRYRLRDVESWLNEQAAP